MIISLNNMRDKLLGHPVHGTSHTVRPDVICLGLLLKAEGMPEPAWWHDKVIAAHRDNEKEHLDDVWHLAAAQLLGLPDYPPGFAEGNWNGTAGEGKEPR
jgi:hypothetical protein